MFVESMPRNVLIEAIEGIGASFLKSQAPVWRASLSSAGKHG